MLQQSEPRRAPEKATHVPEAGTSSVSPFNVKLQVDLPFLEDAIAHHAMDLYPMYSPLGPARSQNPKEI